MNRRARTLSTLLGLILLGCAAVIWLDQRGTFGDAPPALPEQTIQDPLPGTPATPPPPADMSGGGDGGYGDLE